MHRFAIFVDGSNLNGALRRMNLRIDDYPPLFRMIFDRAVEEWRSNINSATPLPAQLFRTYWYEVGTIDEWDLADARVQATLRDWFERDYEVKKAYLAMAGQSMPARSQPEIATEAWALFFNDTKQWYESRQAFVQGLARFHHAIRTGTDFVDLIDCGRLKVDLLHRQVSEKGLDTRMAVDIVTMCCDYDVAILVSGDADNIPSLNHVRGQGRHVVAVEFIGGYPPEKKGATFSSKLKLATDFIIPIYEMDLVTKGIAKKGTGSLSPGPKPAAA